MNLDYIFKTPSGSKEGNVLFNNTLDTFYLQLYGVEHMVDQSTYFSVQPVLHNWYNKHCGMYCPVSGMEHVKDLLLLIKKSNPRSGGSRFSFVVRVVINSMSDV